MQTIINDNQSIFQNLLRHPHNISSGITMTEWSTTMLKGGSKLQLCVIALGLRASSHLQMQTKEMRETTLLPVIQLQTLCSFSLPEVSLSLHKVWHVLILSKHAKNKCVSKFRFFLFHLINFHKNQKQKSKYVHRPDPILTLQVNRSILKL